MKKLLKSEICRSREQYTRPTDVLKMAEKSKFSATVHARYMNSSLCLQLCMQKKKRKKEKGKRKRGKRRRRIRRIQTDTKYKTFGRIAILIINQSINQSSALFDKKIYYINSFLKCHIIDND